MADVFLSYSQRDLRHTRAIIRALESAGLSVWWDRRLLAGNEFSREIREQLETCAAVVVLWSERSVISSWVLDEAANGLNTGRLVPASLDGTEPPLGFGQVHTVDLSARIRGRNQIEELVASACAKVGPRTSAPKPRGSISRLVAAVAAAALVVVGVAIAIYFSRGGGSDQSRFKGGTVAIERFDALTPDQASHAAAGTAEESFERIFSTNFIETLTTWSAPRNSLKRATFALNGTVDSSGDSLHLAVHVLDPNSGEILWSTDASRPISQARELGDELAIVVADVLRCSIYTKRRIPEYDSLELSARILRFCEADRGGLSDLVMDQRPKLAEALLEVAPKSAEAHALLANTLALQYDDKPTPAELALVRSAIAATLALDPKNGSVRWAMAKIADPNVGLAERERFVRDGMALDPDFLWNRVLLGNLMLKVGRIDDGRELFRLFVADYPLDYLQRGVYAYLLAESGDLDSARKQFALIESTRPNFDSWGPPYAVRSELLYGDLQHLKPWLPQVDYSADTQGCILFAAEARERQAPPSPESIEKTCGRSAEEDAMVESMFGHTEEAIRALDARMPALAPPGQFGPHWIFERGFEKLRQDPRLITVLGKAGIPQYWLRTGNFPDFCSREKLPYDCRAVAEKAAEANRSIR